MSNITQVVNTDKNMTTLKKGVHASDLDQLLSSTGPFTMFAPLNLAFEKLAEGTMNKLLEPENKIALTSLINRHVVADKMNFKDLKEGEKLKTVNGRELLIHVKDGRTTVDGAKIQSHDLQAANGVIHSLDTVMFKN